MPICAIICANRHMVQERDKHSDVLTTPTAVIRMSLFKRMSSCDYEEKDTYRRFPTLKARKRPLISKLRGEKAIEIFHPIFGPDHFNVRQRQLIMTKIDYLLAKRSVRHLRPV